MPLVEQLDDDAFHLPGRVIAWKVFPQGFVFDGHGVQFAFLFLIHNVVDCIIVKLTLLRQLFYAGCSPSTYQSGKLTNCYAHMEKRGSRYLRYALYTATKYVCYWNPVFTEYLTKKQAEGKHYNVALSHATKKLVRLIYALQKSGKAYLAVT